MLAYIYNADLYCESCGDTIKDELTKEGKAPIDPNDEYSYDSDDFPKGPFSDGGGEADSPNHCGNRECQVFLENPLTEDGRNYVLDALIENKGSGAGDAEVLALWSDFYGISIEDLE